ncbi:MAG: aspartate kinase, partial [Bacteroidia bacterium]|nr:aspartate kinase [Bacteroidia bacterium]
MKIYKFGGASVKDAIGVRNLHQVLKESGTQNILLVVSAMGKTTNAMEEVVGAKGEKAREEAIQFVYDYHRGILSALFDSDHAIFGEIDARFDQMRTTLETHADSKYNFLYDQVVSFGELLSTQIISAYLNQESIQNTWIDIREIIE